MSLLQSICPETYLYFTHPLSSVWLKIHFTQLGSILSQTDKNPAITLSTRMESSDFYQEFNAIYIRYWPILPIELSPFHAAKALKVEEEKNKKQILTNKVP